MLLVPYPLAQLTHFATHRDDYAMMGPTTAIVGGQLAYYGRWYASVAAERFGRREAALPPTTFVVLSYRRPGNMHALVSGLLALKAAARVVVINNNAELDLAPYLPKDPRIELVRGTGAIGYRYVMGSQATTERVAFIDDDLFVMPDAWKRLLRSFDRAPASPKSLIGLLYVPTGDAIAHPSLRGIPVDFGEGSYFWAQVADEGVVDVAAAGVSVCSREQATRVFEVAKAVGADIATSSVSDDLFFSFAGTERPGVAGAIPMRDFAFCVTATRKRVAISQNGAAYFAERRSTFHELERLRGFELDAAIERRRGEVILKGDPRA